MLASGMCNHAVVPARAVLLTCCAVGLAACSTPSTGDDTLATGKARVTELVVEAATALPGDPAFDEPTVVGEMTCRKKLFGYAIGDAGSRRVEVPLLIDLPEGTETETLLPAIADVWRGRGYHIDRSGLSSERYPKLRARVDGYEVVATAVQDRPQFALYAVSECLES